MDEAFPALAGIAIGLVFSTVSLRERGSQLLFAALVLAAGFTASWINGELAESWLYLLLDVGQTAVAALVVRLALRRIRQRREQRAS